MRLAFNGSGIRDYCPSHVASWPHLPEPFSINRSISERLTPVIRGPILMVLSCPLLTKRQKVVIEMPSAFAACFGRRTRETGVVWEKALDGMKGTLTGLMPVIND
jgi:hypothetical protein